LLSTAGKIASVVAGTRNSNDKSSGKWTFVHIFLLPTAFITAIANKHLQLNMAKSTINFFYNIDPKSKLKKFKHRISRSSTFSF
jgi:hypothetical protein